MWERVRLGVGKGGGCRSAYKKDRGTMGVVVVGRVVTSGFVVFFFNDTATTEIYTVWFVGSVRCV